MLWQPAPTHQTDFGILTTDASAARPSLKSRARGRAHFRCARIRSGQRKSIAIAACSVVGFGPTFWSNVQATPAVSHVIVAIDAVVLSLGAELP